MNVEHAFVTRYESVEAFGLANELLRPMGFTLEDGNPSRSQQWRRPGKEKSRSVLNLAQSLRLEHDKGRITVKMSMEATGGQVATGQKLLLSYAKSLEHLLSDGKNPKAASAHTRSVQRGIRAAAVRKVCTLSAAGLAILAGAGYAALTLSGRKVPFTQAAPAQPIIQAGPVELPAALKADPRNQVSIKPADPNAPKKHTPPVITVRRAGAAPQAAAKSSD